MVCSRVVVAEELYSVSYAQVIVEKASEEGISLAVAEGFLVYLASQRKLWSRRCMQQQRRCKSSAWHRWSTRMSDGSKNPDFSTRT